MHVFNLSSFLFHKLEYSSSTGLSSFWLSISNRTVWILYAFKTSCYFNEATGLTVRNCVIILFTS